MHGRVYSDASMIDGPSLLLGRFGWAFVIVGTRNGQEEVLAAAYGIPPKWVRSLPAAEAWAILMASTVAAPTAPYTTDSLECVKSLARGAAWATAPRRPNARLWGLICAAFDDDGGEGRLTWMPSHRGSHDVGVRLRSDGLPITCSDVRFNGVAGTLAKKAARDIRVPKHVRDAVDASHSVAHWVAKQVGWATVAANNLPASPYRDALPDGGWRSARARQRKPRDKKKKRTTQAQRPQVLGGHNLSRVGRAWKCSVCGRCSMHWSRIAPQRCEGAAAQLWAERARQLCAASGGAAAGGSDGAGHVRFMSDLTTWRDRCGAYADTFAVGLARQCGGQPSCAGKEQHLRRLRRGRHPVTNVPFAGPAIPEPAPWAQSRPLAPPLARTAAWGTPRTTTVAMAAAAGDQLVPARARRTGASALPDRTKAKDKLERLRRRVRDKASARALAPQTPPTLTPMAVDGRLPEQAAKSRRLDGPTDSFPPAENIDGVRKRAASACGHLRPADSAKVAAAAAGDGAKKQRLDVQASSGALHGPLDKLHQGQRALQRAHGDLVRDAALPHVKRRRLCDELAAGGGSGRQAQHLDARRPRHDVHGLGVGASMSGEAKRARCTIRESQPASGAHASPPASPPTLPSGSGVLPYRVCRRGDDADKDGATIDHAVIRRPAATIQARTRAELVAALRNEGPR